MAKRNQTSQLHRVERTVSAVGIVREKSSVGFPACEVFSDRLEAPLIKSDRDSPNNPNCDQKRFALCEAMTNSFRLCFSYHTCRSSALIGDVDRRGFSGEGSGSIWAEAGAVFVGVDIVRRIGGGVRE